MSANVVRDGRYQLLGKLGEGSQGTTFDAIDKKVGRPVAVKRFEVRGAKSWKDVELAEREASVLAALSHPALPAHIDHFEEDGVLYLVMEKVEGENLVALSRKGALGADDVLRFLRDAAGVLEYLHGRSPPVIHRDINPKNVIRRPDGSFAIVDFGAVRDRLRPEGGSTVVGTYGYMAPEQFQGRAMPASDVYAVGATAIRLLTGTDPEDLPHRGLAIDVSAALGPSAEPRMVTLLTRMLEPDPDQRAASLSPLLEELEQRRQSDRYGGRSSEFANAERAHRPATRAERRHAEREAYRAARRRRKGRHGRPVRGPPLLFAILGIQIAILVVALFFGLLLPLGLNLLSIVLGASLRRAARRVSEVGEAARASLRHARGYLLHGETAPNERVRVEEEPAPHRARVEDDEVIDTEGVPGPEESTRRAK